MRSKSIKTFFGDEFGRRVILEMDTVWESRRPSLAERSYHYIGGRKMTYVRLMLPIGPSRDGTRQILKALEPSTVTHTHSAALPISDR